MLRGDVMKAEAGARLRPLQHDVADAALLLPPRSARHGGEDVAAYMYLLIHLVFASHVLPQPVYGRLPNLVRE